MTALAHSGWRDPDVGALPPVLESALERFYANGYYGTSVRDIARGANMTVQGLYYHYAGKQDILTALLDYMLTAVVELCESAAAEAGPDVVLRLRNLVEALTLFMAKHRKAGAMDAEIRALDPGNRAAYGTKRRTVEALLVDAIAQGTNEGEFDVEFPMDTGRALLGMIQAIPAWYRPDGPLTPAELAERYVSVAMRAVGSRSVV